MRNKNIIKGLVLGAILTNTPIYTFANNINIEENKYTKDLSNIKNKEDLQKSAQKAIKNGEVNTWINSLTNMPVNKADFTTAVLDEKIYCIGGVNEYGYLNSVEVYDPITDTWDVKASLNNQKGYLTSAVVDGKIYCIGGKDNFSSLSTVEVYDPSTNTWEFKSSMRTPRDSLTSAVVDGKIYCIGGNRYSSSLNKVEVYDPATDKWETKTSMPTARDSLSSAVIDGKIYCIGGNIDYTPTNIVEVYDPATDKWETKTYMPTRRSEFTASVAHGRIYCIGGSNDSYLNTVEMYDPKTDKWESKSNMISARKSLSSSFVDGKIYCIGGYSNYYMNNVEAYVAEVFLTDEEIAENAVIKAEQTRNPVDIEYAQELVNKLPNSNIKEELKNRLDMLIPKINTSNIDIYIEPKNNLSLTLDTNHVTFEDFDGVDDMIKENAINLTIESSLPYKIDASLETEIQNEDGTSILDKSILGIKSNDSDTYKIFSAIKTPIVLWDNQSPGKSNTHSVDLKINKGINYAVDVYKTVLKFEITQK